MKTGTFQKIESYQTNVVHISLGVCSYFCYVLKQFPLERFIVNSKSSTFTPTSGTKQPNTTNNFDLFSRDAGTAV